MDQHSDNKHQSTIHKRLGGSAKLGYSFLGIKAGGSGSQEKKVDAGDSRDVKISFKVRAVQVNRPWLDLSALRVEHYSIPGEGSGSWSTGELSSSNKGSFPLVTSQVIVAKDITITASKFSKEVIDTVKKFDGSAHFGLVVS